MAVLNIREVPEEVAQAVKVKAVQESVSLREYIINVLRVSVGQKPRNGESRGSAEGTAVPSPDTRPAKQRTRPVSRRVQGGGESKRAKASKNGHDTSSCRIYKCGQCAVLGVKDKRRGIGE